MAPTQTTATCECGCGHPTRIALVNDSARGHVKGQPLRFVHGHNNRHIFGHGEGNVRWLGDEAGRSAIHKWLEKVKPLIGTCEECGATDCRTEHSNIDHKWRRAVEDYRELCARCHRHYDFTVLGTYNPCLARG